MVRNADVRVMTSDRGNIYGNIRSNLVSWGSGQVTLQTLSDLISAFVRLDLGAAAVNLVTHLPPEIRDQPEFTTLRKQLQSVPGGRQHPTALGGRFTRNIDAYRTADDARITAGHLASNIPDDIDAQAAEWRDTHAVFSDRNREISIARVHSSGAFEFVRINSDRADASAVRLPHLDEPETLCPRPYLFEGISPPYLLEHTWRETQDLFNGYSPMLYVLVPSVSSLLAALHTIDITHVLSDPRVSLVVGDGAATRLSTYLQEHPEQRLPKYRFALPGEPPCNPPSADLVNDLDEARTRHALEIQASSHAIYATRDAAWWKNRYEEATQGNGAPLRVMIPVSRFTTYIQHAARQISDAFERAGCEVHLVCEEHDHTVVPVDRYFSEFEYWQPDLVLKIDHRRAESEHVIPENVPYICWVQDRLPNLFEPDAGASINALEVVMGLGIEQLVNQCGYPEQQCVPVLNGTDPSVYDATPLTDAALDAFRCDIAYVSNHSQPPSEYALELAARHVSGDVAHEYFAWVVQQLAGRFERGREPSTGALHPSIFRHPNMSLEDVFPDEDSQRKFRMFVVQSVADRMYRHQALDWVISYCECSGRTLKLFGEGWERHPKTRKYACGPVANGHDLRAVYQAASVNLHMSLFGSLHQRVFDGFASGGLVLCRRAMPDLGFRMYDVASKAAERLGSRQFNLDDAPELYEWLSANLHGGRPIRGNPRWDLDGPRWRRYAGAAQPCFFRSFDELFPDHADDVSFWSAETLTTRLDTFFDDVTERQRLVDACGKRVREELSIDSIATLALARVSETIDRAAASDLNAQAYPLSA